MARQTKPFDNLETAPPVSDTAEDMCQSPEVPVRSYFREGKFASLMVMLALDDTVRGALLRSARGLSREEVDRGETQDSIG